jgi:hypothetical protein
VELANAEADEEDDSDAEVVGRDAASLLFH